MATLKLIPFKSDMEIEYTIWALHPIFKELYKTKTPNSTILLGNNFILDGHHTLFNFCDKNEYGNTIDVEFITAICPDITSLYSLIIIDKQLYSYSYKFTSQTNTYYLQDTDTQTIYEVVFPLNFEPNGYKKILDKNKDNEVLINALKHTLYIAEEDTDADYTDGMISECTLKFITGNIVDSPIITRHTEEYLYSCGTYTRQNTKSEEISLVYDISDAQDTEIYDAYLTQETLKNLKKEVET